jgi:hypothetical protein
MDSIIKVIMNFLGGLCGSCIESTEKAITSPAVESAITHSIASIATAAGQEFEHAISHSSVHIAGMIPSLNSLEVNMQS